MIVYFIGLVYLIHCGFGTQGKCHQNWQTVVLLSPQEQNVRKERMLQNTIDYIIFFDKFQMFYGIHRKF